MFCTAAARETLLTSAFDRLRLAVCTLLLVFAFSGAAHSSSLPPTAEGEFDLARSGKVRIAVIGDSLAFELWKGLHAATKGSKSVEFVKFTRVSTGLMRRDVFDWNQQIRSFVRKNRFDAAVVVLGGNDRQTVWHKGRRLTRGSRPWFNEYANRADQFMDTLRSAGKPVYWVGLPIVRSNTMARDYRELNSIFRRLTARNGATYIDTWGVFADANGRYSAYGRDARGARRIMRNNDGLHFSSYGRLKFGKAVLRHLVREINGVGAS